MVIFKKFLKTKSDKIYTKTHHFKKILEEHAPDPPSKAHGFAMRSMSLCDMQIYKSEKKILAPPPLPNPGDAPVLLL